jgi:hypothetical protein
MDAARQLISSVRCARDCGVGCGCPVVHGVTSTLGKVKRAAVRGPERFAVGVFYWQLPPHTEVAIMPSARSAWNQPELFLPANLPDPPVDFHMPLVAPAP